MAKEDLIQKMEAHIRGELKKPEKEGFENQLNEDADLAREFQLHKALHEELENRPKQALRDKLNFLSGEYMDSIPEPKSKPFSGRWQNYLPGIGIFLIGVVAAWFIVLKGNLDFMNDAAASENATQETAQEASPENTKGETTLPKKKESPTEDKNAEPAASPAEQPKENKASETLTPAQNETPKQKRAIAANFDENPALEKYMTGGSLVRGGDFELTLNEDAVTDVTANNSPLLINYSGKLTSESGDAPGEFKFRLFSNKPEDFQKDKTVAEWNLEFTVKDGTYTFSISEKLITAAGLYYFIIEDWDSGEKYFVGKILFNDE